MNDASYVRMNRRIFYGLHITSRGIIYNIEHVSRVHPCGRRGRSDRRREEEASACQMVEENGAAVGGGGGGGGEGREWG